MRSNLAKAVRKEMKRLFQQRLPEFRTSRDPEVPDGAVLFEAPATEGGGSFCLLLMSPYENWFTAECAYSKQGKYPWTMVPIPGPGFRRKAVADAS